MDTFLAGKSNTIDSSTKIKLSDTDTKVISLLLAQLIISSKLVFKGQWQPNTLYETGNVLFYQGSMYEVLSDFTSGQTFTTDNTKTIFEALTDDAIKMIQEGISASTVSVDTKQQIDELATVINNNIDSANNVISTASEALNQSIVLASTVINNPASFTNRGGWDATNNKPVLTSSVGTEGDFYVITKEGTTTLDTYNNWELLDGIWFHEGKWNVLKRAGYPAIAKAFVGLQSLSSGSLNITDTTRNLLSIKDALGFICAAITASGDIHTQGDKLTLGNSILNLNDNPNWYYRQKDIFNNVLFGVKSDGSTYFPEGNEANIGPLFITTDDNPDGVIIKDKLGFVIIDTSGTFTALKDVGFTDEEISESDYLQLGKSASYMAASHTFKNARPSWNWSLSLATGQSEMMGYVSLPALSTTQPWDNFTFGLDPRGATFGNDTKSWLPRGGDASPKPLIGMCINQDDFSTMYFDKTVVFKPSTVDISVPGNSQIQIDTDDLNIDFTTQFTNNQMIQMAGFTGDASVNNQTKGLWYSNYITITSVKQKTIIGNCSGVWWGWNAYPIKGAKGISIAPLRIGRDFGEQQSIAALNFFRELQLNFRQLPEDSTRQLALVSTCVSGMPLWNLSKNNDNNVFRRNAEVCTIAKQQADAANKSVGLFLIEFCQGGSETTTNYDTYTTLFENYFEDIINDCLPILNQTSKPFIEIVPISGMNMPSIGFNDICRAQVDYASRTPGAYVATVGYPAIDYGFHYSTNGERYVGAMRAKVRHRVINQGLNWKPLIMESAKLKGQEILISCHVPYPPMVALDTWRGQDTVMFDDLGFGVYDSVTKETISVSKAEIVGDTQIKLTLANKPVNPIWITYGDSNHQGSGNIYDSDPATSTDVYEWWEGNGAPYSENLPDLIGKPYNLQNPMINYGILIEV